MISELAGAQRTRGRVWLDLARAGNFPSVWSNVLTALLLSAPTLGAWPRPSRMALALLAGSLAYAGGATLNDVADVRFDAAHRPGRALPTGMVSRNAAAMVGALELALGIALLALGGASPLHGLALAATIVFYDWVHKKWSGAVILMAGCRVLLALTIATLPGQVVRPAFLGWIAVLFAYIVILSAIARAEYRPGAPAARLGKAVGRLLAFMPFVDAVALALVAAWTGAGATALAVPLGRWAQRRAAST